MLVVKSYSWLLFWPLDLLIFERKLKVYCDCDFCQFLLAYLYIFCFVFHIHKTQCFILLVACSLISVTYIPLYRALSVYFFSYFVCCNIACCTSFLFISIYLVFYTFYFLLPSFYFKYMTYKQQVAGYFSAKSEILLVSTLNSVVCLSKLLMCLNFSCHLFFLPLFTMNSNFFFFSVLSFVELIWDVCVPFFPPSNDLESVCKLHFKSVKFNVTTVYMEILIKTQLGIKGLELDRGIGVEDTGF